MADDRCDLSSSPPYNLSIALSILGPTESPTSRMLVLFRPARLLRVFDGLRKVLHMLGGTLSLTEPCSGHITSSYVVVYSCFTNSFTGKG